MKPILIPHITEKSYAGIDESGKSSSTYTFRVAQDLDAGAVRKLVERQFNVNVLDVRMVSLPGKVRRFKGVPGRTSDRKKALVRLKSGQRIDAFDNQTAPANA